ncbi:hypothetical protein [Caulobacter rhizosphaerae]|jgi:hypothetical protein|uniref:hypothetical protein n=1 Tax=Caulobacter rhizosphaerae TaxID=2010972 RepID=UPI0013D2AD4D|nr:hypothetical protein [Caulobacter rhizosphaerae]GGL28084.1 hypothetical protein GCM10010983_26860 [Caulobacter rhizosphaerae]
MGDETNREGLQQQPSDDQRRQSDQQNQQGETRTPQQQRDDEARNAPGQQNQQGQRDPRRDGEGVEGEGVDDLNNGLEGGVDTGAIEPGRTDQP